MKLYDVMSAAGRTDFAAPYTSGVLIKWLAKRPFVAQLPQSRANVAGGQPKLFDRPRLCAMKVHLPTSGEFLWGLFGGRRIEGAPGHTAP